MMVSNTAGVTSSEGGHGPRCADQILSALRGSERFAVTPRKGTEMPISLISIPKLLPTCGSGHERLGAVVLTSVTMLVLLAMGRSIPEVVGLLVVVALISVATTSATTAGAARICEPLARFILTRATVTP